MRRGVPQAHLHLCGPREKRLLGVEECVCCHARERCCCWLLPHLCCQLHALGVYIEH